MQTVITLLEAAAPDLLDRCLAVRQEVFTREMGVPADVERDSRDCLDGECRHFLITRDGRDIGAGALSAPGGRHPAAPAVLHPEGLPGTGCPDARPSPLWKTASGRRGSRLWCWTPNVLPGASMRPAAMRRYPGSFWKLVCPTWQCAGHCDCFSAKKSLSPCAGERALFPAVMPPGFLPRSRARSRRRPVRTQPSTAPAKAPAVSMSTSRRLPSRPGTES